MKNYIKVLVPTILLSTSVAFAQNANDENPVLRKNIAEYDVVEMELADNSKIIQETKATYEVVFDKDDRYKLNQERIVVPPKLETTFKLDSDRDSSYEREITIKYERPEDIRLDFMLTKSGLKVWSDDMKEIHMIDENNNKKKVNMLSSEGMYHIISKDGKAYEIEVVDMK